MELQGVGDHSREQQLQESPVAQWLLPSGKCWNQSHTQVPWSSSKQCRRQMQQTNQMACDRLWVWSHFQQDESGGNLYTIMLAANSIDHVISTHPINSCRLLLKDQFDLLLKRHVDGANACCNGRLNAQMLYLDCCLLYTWLCSAVLASGCLSIKHNSLCFEQDSRRSILSWHVLNFSAKALLQLGINSNSCCTLHARQHLVDQEALTMRSLSTINTWLILFALQALSGWNKWT